MEDKVPRDDDLINNSKAHNYNIQWLGSFLLDLSRDVILVLSEKIRQKLHVPRFVNAMDITESSSNTEIGSNRAQSLVNIMDVFGLSVQARIVYTSIVDTIFLSSRDTDLHLEPNTDGCHALEVFFAYSNVFLLGLFGEIQHVGGEKRFLMLLEVRLISLEHAIKPWEELFSTMVAV
jgi:hypothetical protein